MATEKGFFLDELPDVSGSNNRAQLSRRMVQQQMQLAPAETHTTAAPEKLVDIPDIDGIPGGLTGRRLGTIGGGLTIGPMVQPKQQGR